MKKQGKPISYYLPDHICQYCNRDLQYGFWECIKPERKDVNGEYTNPCTAQDWVACPLNPANKIKGK